MESYADILFTPTVQAEQARFGSRDKFLRVYRNRFRGDLDDRTRAFIESRTSVYMATVSETGWPYVQHRGGPAGFLKVLDGTSLGFADYHGNEQFISMGNLQTDDRVSLFLMDYPTQSRLKLIGRCKMTDAIDEPDLALQLQAPGQGPVERVARITLSAMDWNCPKYIEQRYTQDEVLKLVGPQLAKRDQTISLFRRKLEDLGVDPDLVLSNAVEEKP